MEANSLRVVTADYRWGHGGGMRRGMDNANEMSVLNLRVRRQGIGRVGISKKAQPNHTHETYHCFFCCSLPGFLGCRSFHGSGADDRAQSRWSNGRYKLDHLELCGPIHAGYSNGEPVLDLS